MPRDLHKIVARNLERYARSGTTTWLARHADETCTIGDWHGSVELT